MSHVVTKQCLRYGAIYGGHACSWLTRCKRRASTATLCAVAMRQTSPASRLFHTSGWQPDLLEFFDSPDNWGAQEVKVGRAWKIEELRLKSNQDLHKLWYVLLKERNMLFTMEHHYEKVENEHFPNPERIDKVEESMSNLEKVVKERNKAYYQLEVSEAEEGIQPHRRERNEFGLLVERPLSEYVRPETEETRYRPAAAHSQPDVAQFLKRMSELKRTERNRQHRRDERHVIGLLRHFPDLDDEVLRSKFPNVDLSKVRRDKRVRANRENAV